VLEADAELPVNPQQLQDLIQKEATKITTKKTQSFKKELAELRTLLAKNVGRGAPPKGASNKKKKRGGKVVRDAVAGAAEASAAIETSTQSGDGGGRSRNPNRNRQSHGKKGQQKKQRNRRADAARNDSNGDSGRNARRRSRLRSRSRNRNNGGARRNNRSSLAWSATLRQPMGLLQTQVFQTGTMPPHI
jgi:hypothetical protein